MTRKLKKGGYTAVLSIVVIAAVIVVNMIVGRLPQKIRQWDVSGSQIYTIGDTTKELLASLDKDVTIYVVADPSAVDERITNFVGRYSDSSDRIKVETVDSVLHPDKVKQLEAENNTLLVRCDDTNKSQTIAMKDIIKYDEASYYYYGQSKETEFDGEGQLTSAISYVMNDTEKTVYITEGHGEQALGATVSDMLKKSSLTADTVNLLKDGGIPEDCRLLFINAPENDLANDEKTMVEDYLNKGGQVMMIAGYSQKELPNVQAILNDYGMKLENGIAADTQNYYQNNPYYIFPTLTAGSEVLTGIDQKSTALVIQSGALSRMETLPADVTVEPFMETSDGGLLVNQEGQKQGTYILGAVAEKTLDSGTARLTVMTTPSLIDEGINTTFTNLTNLDIFMNAVTANYDDVANVSIPSKSLEITYNTVTHGGTWGILFILVIPAVTLAVGFVIWLKRRRM